MLSIAAGLALIVAFSAIVLGIFGSQRGQRAQYYAMRRAAQDQAARRFGFAFWCTVFAGLLFALSYALPSDLPASDTLATLETAAPIEIPPALLSTVTALPTPTEANDARAIAAATSPSSPSSSPHPPPTPPPTALTQTQTTTPATATPTRTRAQPTAKSETPPATPTAAGTTESAAPFQQLALRAIGTGWGSNGELDGVSTEFAVGTRAIFVFFTFQQVPRGSQLRHIWLKDGKSLSFASTTFNKTGKGTDAVSWSPKGGFQVGLYEVRISLGNTQQFVANFLVR
jgi:hypothetical protein